MAKEIVIDPKPTFSLSPDLYMQFMEPLGTTDGSVEAAWDHLRSDWRPRERTVLYRMIDYIGRWSLIDMFMVSILVALVQLGAVATIEAGLGAGCFASVVVITIFAAMSFDSRLIWDAVEERT